MNELLSKQEIIKRKQKFETLCGIYFLIDEGEVVYVGQSVNIPVRIAVHANNPNKQFDSYAYVEAEWDELDDLETEYIVALEPKYNSVMPKSSQWVSMHKLKEVFGVNAWAIKRHAKKKNVKPFWGVHYRIEWFKDFEETA